MTRDVVIVGCGGHGREALGAVRAINDATPGVPPWRPVGFVDDKPSGRDREQVERLGLRYLGPVDWLAEVPPGTCMVLGVRDPRARRSVAWRAEEHGVPAATLVHPAATLGPGAVAGEGLLALAGARVAANATLGRHVHLDQNATVGHDCVLDDFVSVGPLAAVCGECYLQTGVLVGATAAVLPGLRVGADSIVAAGACVVRDVPPRAVVKGVPAQ